MQRNVVHIPREEFPKRWKKVQEVMRKNQIDVLLTYSDDRATYGNAYARYYANVPTHFEPVIIMFLQENNPIILTGPETDGYAKEIGVIQDIRVLQELSSSDEDYPFSTIEPLAKIIKQSAPHEIKRIGLAGLTYMGAELYEAVTSACKGIELIDAAKLIDLLRGIKTNAEIAVIRKAYEIADAGMQAAIKAIQPGVTEREVAAEAEYVMRRLGAEGYGIDTMVASGSNTKHIISRTTQREIQNNEVVVVTLAPRYEGYHGACGRPVFLGTPDTKTMEAAEAMVKAQKACMENMMPGKLGSKVEAMGRQIMKKAGYERNFMYSGLHSIGVIEFEPPILGPSSTTVIQKNMTISVDIPLYEADMPGMRLETGYLVHENGAQKLSTTEWLVRK